MRSRPWAWLLAGAGVVLLALLIQSRTARKPAAPAKPVAALTPAPVRDEAVAALGRLEPNGDVRRLAAPISGIGGSPVLTALLVQEGDRVRQGQLLARFDTRPGLLADQRKLRTRVANLQ